MDMSIIGKQVKFYNSITDHASIRGVVLDKFRGMHGDAYLVQNLTTGACHCVAPGKIEAVQDMPQVAAAPTIDAENPESQALYTEADLVTFGNYLLGDDRRERIERAGVYSLTSHSDIGIRLSQVSDADIANWRESKDKS